jgi:hypothetical protein
MQSDVINLEIFIILVFIIKMNRHLRYVREEFYHPITNIKFVTFTLRHNREFFTNDVSLNKYDDGEYDNLINDMNTALHTLGYAELNIYTDASGTIFANDSNGNPITNRLIVTTSYTYPYLDLSGNFVFGYFTVVFDDKSTFSNTDDNNLAYWYSIYGMDPLTIKQFT